MQWLLSQARNNIFQLFQSLKPTTHDVQVSDALGPLQCVILHSPQLHKSYIKKSFLQLLLSQARNNIFQLFQSLKPTTHDVQVTSALGPLQ